MQGTPLPTAKGVVLEFDMGGGKKAPSEARPAPGKHDKPWRKSAAAVKAEREKSAAILGSKGGVDHDAMRLVLGAQELLDTGRVEAAHVSALQAATTMLLQVATNARPPDEVAQARMALEAAASTASVGPTLTLLASGSGAGGVNKLQLLHEVAPRLWVGGWAALNNDCEVLRKHKVTHVLSVLSADQRRLPAWIQGHHYVRVDDSEEAAETLASHFESTTAFIEAARSNGGVVFVHCGAGISRAPTTACAYLIWKLRMRAADAISMVRKVRHNVRPNPGFVAQLKAWESKVLASPERVSDPGGPSDPSTPSTMSDASAAQSVSVPAASSARPSAMLAERKLDAKAAKSPVPGAGAHILPGARVSAPAAEIA